MRTLAVRTDGHTRLPQYLARRRGRIESVHGPFPLADESARGAANATKSTLYTVVFDGREVWGARANTPLSIAADLWDAYLELEAP